MAKIDSIVKTLRKMYPNEFHGTIIHYKPFPILIGTILSHQTPDPRTIKAEKRLFAIYTTPEQIANAPVSKIKELIKPVGIYNIKAKRLKQVCSILVEKYGGKVPRDYNELLKLPGVGRKTANIVFTYAFGKSDLIAVDVHVNRISNRLGIVKTKTPEKTEFALYKAVPKKYWRDVNELMVQHGQTICAAKPKCYKCDLRPYCDYYQKVIKPKKIPGSFTPPKNKKSAESEI